eukprot:TRINITY_DN7080_c0_g3_i1.p1 TRINITY_DN7080_c0_g3~~TRINITY_DN7080_c0_g3_i1.p1  ORF type:complete len:994 (+),score=239.15 TRINITY_DN7080_c0_g3_i1:232-2982(+)
MQSERDQLLADARAVTTKGGASFLAGLHELCNSPRSSDEQAPGLKPSKSVDVEAERRRALLQEACRRASSFEEALELQRSGLKKRKAAAQHANTKNALLAGQLLEHQSALAELVMEGAHCLQRCESSSQEAMDSEGPAADTTRDWQQLVAYWKEKCAQVSTCETQMSLLCEEIAVSGATDTSSSASTTAARVLCAAAAPGTERVQKRLHPRRHEDDTAEMQAALVDAARRAARFDDELERQRANLKRRGRRQAEVLDEAVLQVLVTERRAALESCEVQVSAGAQEHWHEICDLWRGKLSTSLEELAVEVARGQAIPEASHQGPQRSSAEYSSQHSHRHKATVVDDAAERAEIVGKARRRLAILDEDLERQRLGLQARKRRRSLVPGEEAEKKVLMQLVEQSSEFGKITEEHSKGLQQQETILKEVMQADSAALEDIEAWRQLVGLEELQVAAATMAEHLPDVAEEVPFSIPGQLEEAVVTTVGDSAEQPPGLVSPASDRAAARRCSLQCAEMQARLAELHADEEEAQRLRFQRRQKRRQQRAETAAESEAAAEDAMAKSRNLLLKAQEQLAQGGGSSKELQQQLQEVRKEAAGCAEEEQKLQEEEEVVEADIPEKEQLRVAVSPEAVQHTSPKAELAAALAEAEERVELVSQMGVELLSQLQTVFQQRQSASTGDLEIAVTEAVDRWRLQLPPADVSKTACDETRLMQRHLDGVAGAAKHAAETLPKMPGKPSGEAFLESWQRHLDHDMAEQAAQEQDMLQAEFEERRRERQGHKEQANLRPRPARWRVPPTRSQVPTSSTKTARSEVRRLREAGEAAARSFHQQTEEQDEEQALVFLRRVSDRKSRLRQSRSVSSSPSGSFGAGRLSSSPGIVTRDLSDELQRSWVWSPHPRLSRTLDFESLRGQSSDSQRHQLE